MNGDFGDNKCGGNNVCIWDQSNYQNYVNGWSVSPSTEIGYAFIYNSEIIDNRFVTSAILGLFVVFMVMFILL